jgi:formate/nitrite transporter FocA (FNT family)
MNSPAEVAKNYLAIGKAKTQNGFMKLFVLGILAGAFIALAAIGATTAAVSVASASVGKFLGACVFPVGLTMVLIAGSELFTGNALIIIPVLSKEATWGGMLRNWVIVYIANFIGSIAVAALVVYGHTPDLFGGAEGGLAASIVKAAAAKSSLSFWDAFIRGILCNFLVCIAVWISFAPRM